MRWTGHVALMEDLRKTYKILIGELEGKRVLGKTRHRWEDNIKLHLNERKVRMPI
jgi:hypothetical protein